MAYLDHTQVQEAITALDAGNWGIVRTFLHKMRDDVATPDEIEAARSEHGTDECEIDDEMVGVSRGNDGVWVAAWVWVPDDEEDD